MSSVTAVKAEVKPKPEGDIKPSGGGPGTGVGGGQNNRGGGGGGGPNNKRKRGGGPQGPGRNSFGGRGGGGNQGGGGGNFNDRRQSNFGGSDHPHGGGGGGGPMNKRPKVMGGGGGDGRVFDKLHSIQGPTGDLPPKKFELRKFLANTRLYIGNIASEVSEAEIKDLFTVYGEVDEVFINREKNFAFLKLDYRTNAERARSELDQKQVRGRPIKVRFAPATVRIKVKNLGSMVSNELLELGFSIFGEIERALVFVDDKGKSLGEGIIDFTRKNNAVMANKFCNEKCFFLTSELRPVITEMGDMCEVDEGLLEMNLPKREFVKGRDIEYYKTRQMGPRVAEEGSFEAEYGQKWKLLMNEYKEKEQALKEELEKELEKLQAQMELTKYDYETEMLRQQLRQRELDHERQKAEWENRMSRVPRNFGSGGGGGGGGRGNMNMDVGAAMDQGGLDDIGGGGANNIADRNNIGLPLAPPPMPPQGLMAHLQDGPGSGGTGPTWELPVQRQPQSQPQARVAPIPKPSQNPNPNLMPNPLAFLRRNVGADSPFDLDRSDAPLFDPTPSGRLETTFDEVMPLVEANSALSLADSTEFPNPIIRDYGHGLETSVARTREREPSVEEIDPPPRTIVRVPLDHQVSITYTARHRSRSPEFINPQPRRGMERMDVDLFRGLRQDTVAPAQRTNSFDRSRGPEQGHRFSDARTDQGRHFSDARPDQGYRFAEARFPPRFSDAPRPDHAGRCPQAHPEHGGRFSDGPRFSDQGPRFSEPRQDFRFPEQHRDREQSSRFSDVPPGQGIRFSAPGPFDNACNEFEDYGNDYDEEENDDYAQYREEAPARYIDSRPAENPDRVYRNPLDDNLMAQNQRHRVLRK